MDDLKIIEDQSGTLQKKIKKISNSGYDSILSPIYPGRFPKAPRQNQYSEDDLYNFIKKYDADSIKFSDKDSSVFKKFIEGDILHKKVLLTSKEKIDIVYIEDIIANMSSLLRKERIKESIWQRFFSKHKWIFTNILHHPVSIMRENFSVGHMSFDGTDTQSRIDYLIENDLTENIGIIEIKTHKTSLTAKSEYRPGLYSASKELVGSVIQVQDQKTKLYKNFDPQTGKKNSQIIVNSQCIVIIGDLSKLNIGQKNSFEYFRSACKEVSIITYDELLKKIEKTLEVFTQKNEKKL